MLQGAERVGWGGVEVQKCTTMVQYNSMQHTSGAVHICAVQQHQYNPSTTVVLYDRPRVIHPETLDPKTPCPKLHSPASRGLDL